MWVSALREEVERQVGKPPLKANIILSKGTVSSSSSATSPMPAHGGRNMEALKAAIENEKEDEKFKKAAKGRTPAKAAKQKVAIPFTSSCRPTASSSDGAQPPEMTKATAMGKQPTHRPL